MRTALVTGGTGYVAGHLVQQLLQEGWRVHATVRDPSDARKMQVLSALGQAHPGRLHCFAADLLQERSFDGAMQGCDTVFHVASPFHLPERIRDPQRQLIDPALQGTRNVLASVDRTSCVEQVVLTSSIGAMFGDYSDVMDAPGRMLTEDRFNTTSTLHHNPYHYSKVLAEREAWRIAGDQSRWRLVALHPGLVLGPPLGGGSVSGSLFLLDELLRGVFFYGVPDFSFATVDVRDVARAHLAAASNGQASGRYIVAERTMVRFAEMARMVRPVHPRPWLLPRHQLPGGLVRLIGPLFGLSPAYVRGHLGIRFELDNRRSQSELGLRYRPIEETLQAHCEAWLAQRGARRP
ncbi:NAD-dependent epimerase/dehydratase family protein [Acidovorax sp. NCPPB 3859]|nr:MULTISPECIES: NAD-dependent epimerase/dehydratase family protein [unclassified Acidovorax]MDA8448643.1 NAD-dependent epimerase/dehydratase family protein [Acidovorax sp. GBBC 3297]MDA8458238.1 NAD-dependent epimerase/dehydratase family protein [Acidovorax sp. GBBC 3333]MDA8463276.1 NAD-dependent epimerase/dehydratase family protein [Acidovorax sp. GBBC 3332]MDA8468119.1 NAD-dependent epimerase/dehydratase family protein [Acidovorax sp. GBBC 3299]WCM79728.1 NAD-dependent epimerase/dehydratas